LYRSGRGRSEPRKSVCWKHMWGVYPTFLLCHMRWEDHL